MFKTLTPALLALAALVTASTPAQAQGPEWDRRISDVRIVHPPGTPPGTWRVTTEVTVMSTPLAPTPTNLGMDLVLSLDGMPYLTVALVTEAVAAPIACFPTSTCPNNGCNFWQVTTSGVIATNSSFCYDPPGSTWGCNCWLDGWFPWIVDLVVPPNTLVEVTLSSRAGTLPELFTANDSFGVRISDAIPGVDFCFGDGTGVACPCANAGAPGNGCANSLNAAGAYLGTSGTASVTGDTVVLTGSGMPNSTCLYFQGTTQLAGTPFGDGLRCAGGAVVRLAAKANSGGASTYPSGLDLPVSVKGLIGATGGNRTYQAWYRNAGAFCTASTFNLTNGTAIAWTP